MVKTPPRQATKSGGVSRQVGERVIARPDDQRAVEPLTHLVAVEVEVDQGRLAVLGRQETVLQSEKEAVTRRWLRRDLKNLLEGSGGRRGQVKPGNNFPAGAKSIREVKRQPATQ